MKKLNARGFSHHFLLPLVVILAVGGVGAYVYMKSKASTMYSNGPLYTGSYFVNPDGTGQVYHNYNSGSYQSVGLSFSSNGSQIAYAKSTGAQNDSGVTLHNIYTAKSDGTDEKLVASNLPADFSNDPPIKWSPDGQWLLLEERPTQSTNTISLVHPDGTGYTTITPYTGNDAPPTRVEGIGFYPDSTSIFYMGGYGRQICKTNVTNSLNTCKEAFSYNSFGDEINMSWSIYGAELSPEGDKIAFSRSMTDFSNPCPTVNGYPSCPFTTNLYTMNADGSNIQRVTQYQPSSQGAWINGTIWSPDGKLLAYGAAGNLYTNTPAGGNEKKLSDGGAYFIAWQPIPLGGTQPPLPSSVTAASCEINPPTNFTAGQTTALTATIKNTGVQPVTLSPKVLQQPSFSDSTQSATLNSMTLAVGASQTVSLPSFTVRTASQDNDTYYATVADEFPSKLMYCQQSVPLPMPTISVSNPLTQNIRYGTSFTVNGKTTSPNGYVTLYYGNGWNANGKADATGNFTISQFLPQNRDNTYYVQAAYTSIKTPVHTVKQFPNVAGALTRTVKKGSTATVSGTYTPGTTVTIYMRRPTDPAGTYPLKAYAKADSYGKFKYTYTANTKRLIYAVGPNGAKSPVYTYNIQ